MKCIDKECDCYNETFPENCMNAMAFGVKNKSCCKPENKHKKIEKKLEELENVLSGHYVALDLIAEIKQQIEKELS